MSTSERIRQFVLNNFLLADTDGPVTDDTPLLESNILNSTGVAELIVFIGDEFGIDVPPEDLLPGNFNSIRALATYVQRRLEV